MRQDVRGRDRGRGECKKAEGREEDVRAGRVYPDPHGCGLLEGLEGNNPALEALHFQVTGVSQRGSHGRGQAGRHARHRQTRQATDTQTDRQDRQRNRQTSRQDRQTSGQTHRKIDQY